MADRIYFDACCLNRPFDNQRQGRIRLETVAIMHILRAVEQEQLIWVSSSAVHYEIKRCSDMGRQKAMLAMCNSANEQVTVDAKIKKRVNGLRVHGLRLMDAVHLACAEHGKATVLLTTDDRFLKATGRIKPPSPVRVVNPTTYATEI